MTQKIIIDTDPGVDDAFAIMLAFNSPELDVLGLTTVFGNVNVEQTSHNGLIMADFAPYSVPVFKGCAKPLEKELLGYAEFVHGDDGFGNINWPASDKTLGAQHAVDWMIETIKANPGEISLVPLGPLTNIGELVRRAPEVVPLVKQVVLMGGAVYHPGNISPVAEANVYNDPLAADLVFNAEWPVVMMGLDVTSQMILTKEITARIAAANPRQGEFLHKCADFYIDFYQQDLGVNGCYLHDPSTVVYLTHPQLFGTAEGRIRVITDGLGIGQTTFAPGTHQYPLPQWNDSPVQKVCLQVQGDKVLALVEERLSIDPAA